MKIVACVFVSHPTQVLKCSSFQYPDGDTSVLADANPTLQLPHFLRILGPSSLTLYKHVLGRRRILIYTQPPVEAACILCQVAADMCFEDQTAVESVEGVSSRLRQRGKQKGGINVLGAITLHDINVLEHESNSGCGWIACAFVSCPLPFCLLTDFVRYDRCRVHGETAVLRPRH